MVLFLKICENVCDDKFFHKLIKKTYEYIVFRHLYNNVKEQAIEN
jgi:hypothetical protein